MTNSTSAKVRPATTCSGCFITTRLDLHLGTATVTIPSNGKRGALHEPAHVEGTTLTTTDDYLWMWECPNCGYADSWTPDEEED